ncbi:MAG: glucose-6-phosphate dehydrogenase [Desulfobulbaceae bacterium]|nr:glucose-6-phosphate dehydrogenase [Desulfobulbaceae bacterium]
MENNKNDTQATKEPVCAELTDSSLTPCTIVIFGASGDLTARKIIPALFHLFCNNGLPSQVAIVGCARTAFDDQKFRGKMHEATQPECAQKWDEFASHLHYRSITYDSMEKFTELRIALQEIDRQHQTGGNQLFYMATPPTLYPLVADMIGKAGLISDQNNSWSRIVVEKPFGSDLKTAKELDATLHNYFTEHQIFRIDHYLAKETVQNILMLRFANTIFEPLWNRNYIEYVGIIAAEKLGVEHRAGYYDQAGVLRDMFQNHMLQLLSLTAMEAPSLFVADRVRDEKIKVFRSQKPFDRSTAGENLVLGQYQSGMIDGDKVIGYLDEPDVNEASRTPTFAMMRVFVDNWRWRHVPFYMVSGKRLPRKETKIVIQFKEVPHSMFAHLLDKRIDANRLTLSVYPNEEIKLTFQTKTPGPSICLEPANLAFQYQQQENAPLLDAYEKVLLDCMVGDQTLFWRQDSVEQCWKFLTPVLDECKICEGEAGTLHPYAAGTWGPEAAQKWMRFLVD